MEITNYTRDKRPFRHHVTVEPLRNKSGAVAVLRARSSAVRPLAAGDAAAETLQHNLQHKTGARFVAATALVQVGNELQDPAIGNALCAKAPTSQVRLNRLSARALAAF